MTTWLPMIGVVLAVLGALGFGIGLQRAFGSGQRDGREDAELEGRRTTEEKRNAAEAIRRDVDRDADPYERLRRWSRPDR